MSLLWLSLKRRWHLKQCRDSQIQSALSAPWPKSRLNWRDVSWLAIDIETTGLNPRGDQIISIGWVAIENGSIPMASIQRWLVKTRDSVGSSATIHYLRDEDLKQGTALRHALTALVNAMSGRICVFHNKALDTAFLSKALQQQFGICWFWPSADTLALELKRMQRQGKTPKNNDLRLAACRSRYDLPDYPLHDASHDALACAELFIAWAMHCGGKGPALKDCLNWSR